MLNINVKNVQFFPRAKRTFVAYDNVINYAACKTVCLHNSHTLLCVNESQFDIVLTENGCNALLLWGANVVSQQQWMHYYYNSFAVLSIVWVGRLFVGTIDLCFFLASSIDVHCLLPSFCVVLHCLPLLPAVYLWGHFESKQTETCVCVRSFLVLQLNWLHVLLTEISHHWAPASSSINNSSCRQLHDTFKSINHRSMTHKNGSLMGFVSVCAYSDSIKDVWSVFCLKLLKYTKNAVYKN